MNEETYILTSSENTNNENREKELLGFQPSDEDTEEDNDGENDSTTTTTNAKPSENLENENDDKKEEQIESSNNKKEDNNNKNDTSCSDSGNNSTNQEKNLNNNSKTNDENDYSKHVVYNELGEAIYTDPITKYKYRWSQDKNDWEPLDENVNNDSTTTVTTSNPYENEHYRWCSKTNQWIPKIKNEGTTTSTDTVSSNAETMETEFYRWDKEIKQWIPKTTESTENIVYRYEDGVHTYKDQDGVAYFWDTDKNAWFPKIDDEFMARYQLNYGFIDNTSSSTESKEKTNINSNSTVDSIKEKHKDIDLYDDIEANEYKIQSSQQSEGGSNSGLLKRKLQEPPKWFDIPPEQNTKVYVSNLPEDITEDEFIEVMAKCGLIMRDPKTQKYKIKLYADSNGQLKGDGLCDYIKVESVDLALNLLDGYDVRGHKIKVQRAKFEMRGEYNPALKPKRKKKEKEKLQKMKERLFDWRPEKMRGERSKHERNVIIKNLFEPELFDKEVHLIIEYQNDLREECSKCGTVRKVVIFDRHPDGVAQITMSSPEEADLVVQMMNRRYFGQRRLLAEIWDGKTKYKIAETDAETQKRISQWDKFLEEGGEDGKDKQKKCEKDENNSSVTEMKTNET